MNPLPFLTNNPDIRGIKAVAESKSNSKLQVSQRKTIKCPYCDESFTRSNKQRKYCSVDCQIKYGRNRWKDKRKDIDKQSEKKRRDLLSDSMVRKHLYIALNRKGKTISYDQITPEMIMKNRASILAYRKRQEEKVKIYPSCRVWFNECKVCGDLFVARMPTAKYCSDECKYEKFKRNQRKKYKKAWEKPEPFKCKECGKIVEIEFGEKHSKYCSEICMNRAIKRNSRHIRRLRKKNGNTESIYKAEICERDKWTCHICGKKIDRRTKCPHPMSLSFDHIIPLSEGGTHEPKNISVAHLICNSLKGNRVAHGSDQLRMF